MLFPLLRGACVVIAGDMRAVSPRAFWEKVAAERIAQINFVPSFLEACWPAPRRLRPRASERILVGGEAVPGALLEKLRPRLSRM